MSQLSVGQKIMTETLRLPSFQVQAPGDWETQDGDPGSEASAGGNEVEVLVTGCDPSILSSSATPSLHRKRFKMRRMKNVQSESSVTPAVSAAAATMRSEVMSKSQGSHSFSGAMEYLQLPSIEITPSSDKDAAATWSSCSTPSTSPRRKSFLLHRWLNMREKKEHDSESSRENSLQSSHEEDSARFLTPHSREERPPGGRRTVTMVQSGSLTGQMSCGLGVRQGWGGSLRRRLAFRRVKSDSGAGKLR
ncbi:uncharacterized protein LOC121574237 [Coregonus clupeaformis]|uniref:uncharacterized protein LOC121574237 n=1 Tax=Coregonus clupeaformis TaxID=59861 RepID=UPI001E1C3F70|nr:uncharacterized protein LOC121574237 [Coregonus clupeaformis]